MSERISRDKAFVEMAFIISKRSTCTRAQVGALIVKNGRPLSLGYNGSLPGEDHCHSEICNADEPCLNSVHAEANAIYYAARAGLQCDGATLYCTHSPCKKCSEAIIQAGISKIIYIKEYRETPFDLLIKHNIELHHWE